MTTLEEKEHNRIVALNKGTIEKQRWKTGNGIPDFMAKAHPCVRVTN